MEKNRVQKNLDQLNRKKADPDQLNFDEMRSGDDFVLQDDMKVKKLGTYASELFRILYLSK